MLLPIPGKKETVRFYYVPYDIKENYMNKQAEIVIRTSDTWMEFREALRQKYGLEHGAYTITKVSDNAYKQFFNST